jgi:hypothetical protein
MKPNQFFALAALGVAAAILFTLFPRAGHAAEPLNWTPVHSAQSMSLPGGEQGYQVECHGLLESGKICAVEARRTCDTVRPGSIVRPLIRSQPLNTIERSPEPDYRSMTFQCANENEAK